MLKIAYHSIYTHPLPKGHRFPMVKYELLPKQLILEGTCSEEHFFTPSIPDLASILAVHDKGYVDRLTALALTTKEVRKIWVPLS